jgi:hypothetical protein
LKDGPDKFDLKNPLNNFNDISTLRQQAQANFFKKLPAKHLFESVEICTHAELDIFGF